MQAPLALINSTQGWFAVRWTAAALIASTGRRLFSWYPDGTHQLEVYQSSIAQSFGVRMARTSPGGSSADALDANPTSGDHTTIGKWTSTQIGMSTDGAAFTLVANTFIPTFSGTYFDLGRLGTSATGWLGTPMYWCAAGTGTLTDADAATIHANGNSDPLWQNMPGTITFLWKCVDFTYEDAAPGGGAASSSQNMTMLGVG